MSSTSTSTSTPSKPPKALLFDIGGVCVASPLGAILSYELSHGIPAGWVNFAISRSSRGAGSDGGAWQKIETGQIPMDREHFFEPFGRDLTDPALWKEFLSAKHKNTAHSGRDEKLPPADSAPPRIDAEDLFWTMMGASRTPDPYVYPALLKLKESGRFRIAALSNTVIFPDGHPYNDDIGVGREGEEKERSEKALLKGLFEVYVSSAHVGMRKPDPRIYRLALQRMRERWSGDDLQPGDVLFLDDIGANLSAARKLGFGTIKVELGNTKSAVVELERITGMKLVEQVNEAKL